MGNAQTQTQVPNSERVPVSTNYMLALMNAVCKDQTTMANQQITDANQTQLAVKIEQGLYTYWMGALDAIAKKMAGYTDSKGKWHKPLKGDALTTATYQYQADSSKAQSMESQQDGAVQASQGQTSSDATNLQMKAQMVQGVNSIETTLVNYLGQVTA